MKLSPHSLQTKHSQSHILKRGTTIQTFSAVLVIAVVVCLGVYLLVLGHAASPYASLNAVNGTLASGAMKVSDPGASDGSAVQFGNNGSVLDKLELGATLTDPPNLSEALPASLLSSTVRYVNLSLDANGTGDPEPSPGVYDWSSLDSRMAQLAPVLAANPNITITMRVFGAPCWMESTTDNCPSDVDLAVLPQYYQDFADLVTAAAQKYPEIHYFAIWNELYGYRSTNTWDIQDYTNLYNTVYTSLKTYNPQLKVGGPYDPFPVNVSGSGQYNLVNTSAEAAMTYWLQHKDGADFIAIDGRTAGVPPAIPTQPVAYTAVFAQVTNWIRQQPGYDNLPIWWMEWYARPASLTAPEPEWGAISTYSLMQMVTAGANNAIIWDAENDGNPISTPGLWTQGSEAPTVLVPVYEMLQNELYNTNVTLYSPTPGIEVLGNDSHYVAVDIDGASHVTDILGQPVSFGAWQIITK
jgi:hypothetical protein